MVKKKTIDSDDYHLQKCFERTHQKKAIKQKETYAMCVGALGSLTLPWAGLFIKISEDHGRIFEYTSQRLVTEPDTILRKSKNLYQQPPSKH